MRLKPRNSNRANLMTQKNTLEPGATLGILGGGQLGKMLTQVAKRYGYKVIVLDPTPNSPAGQVADQEIIASLDDKEAAFRLGELSDVITYEFENIDINLVRALEEEYRIYPNSKLLEVTQHRGTEKCFLQSLEISVANFALLKTADELQLALQTIGTPAVLKTCRFGYDGKGQVFIHDKATAMAAFEKLQGVELIWEQCVEIDKEISVICTRGQDKNLVFFPIAENRHKDSILEVCLVPAEINQDIARHAQTITQKIAEALDIVGTFTIEFFLLTDGHLLVNEMAPRPHNSGHYSIEACITSQFENQMRAVCGLPLGSTRLLRPAVMVNVLGESENAEIQGLANIIQDNDVHFHWYGKHNTKAKRKMGHITALGETREAALEKALKARDALHWK